MAAAPALMMERATHHDSSKENQATGVSMSGEIVRPGFRRDYRIDILRGLAILSVLLLHFHFAYNLLKSPMAILLPKPYLVNLVWNGNYGVTVFFVISGYLITSTSLRRFGSLGGISAKVFYAFRFARIVPCLVLVLAIITGLALAKVSAFSDTKNVSIWLADLSVITFWHNVMMVKYGYFNYCLDVFWSLSVEEAFYLGFPLLCLWLRRPRWIVMAGIVAVIVGPIYRRVYSHREIQFLYGYLACFDAIAMGCITAVLARRWRIANKVRNLLQLAALAFMTWIFLRAGIGSVPVWGPSLMAIGAAVFLFAEGAGRREEMPAKSMPLFEKMLYPIAWFGQHSYELYLFHIVILAGMRTLLPQETVALAAKPAWLVFFVASSALVGWLIARFYSEPMNRGLRAKLVKVPLAR
jgi:peptidoglycan/LPS O-acetylase OafA/YrhL